MNALDELGQQVEQQRLGAALARLTARQRAQATRGLTILAAACRGVAVRVDR